MYMASLVCEANYLSYKRDTVKESKKSKKKKKKKKYRRVQLDT